MKTPLLLIIVPILHASIIDNCIRYFSSTELQKSICLECRDGFYIRTGTCVQCNKIIKIAECVAVRTFNYGSNLVIVPTVVSNATDNGTNVGAVDGNVTNTPNATLEVPVQKEVLLSGQTLQNCKEVGQGKCIKCFPGYQMVNGPCTKKQTNKMDGCFVFSEIQYKCVMCEDTLQLTPEGTCKLGANVTKKPDPVPKSEQGYVVSAEPIYVRAEVLSTLQKGNMNQRASPRARLQNLALDSLVLMQPQLDQTLNSTNLTTPLPVIDLTKKQIKHTNGNLSQNLTTPHKNLIKLQQDRSLQSGIFIKIAEDDFCIEHDKTNPKLCLKCQQSYLLNQLLNKCITISKPIQLMKPTPPTPTPANTTAQTQNKQINNSNSTGAVPVLPTMLPQPDPSASASTTITIYVSSGNMNNAIINISTNVPKQGDGSTYIITQPGGQANTTASTPTPTISPTNITTNTTTNITPSLISNPSNTNSTIPHPAIAPTTAKPSPIATIIQNNTTTPTNNSITPSTISPTNTTTNTNTNTPKTPSLVQKCIKYKQTTNQCIQCQLNFQLYLGKCYDQFSYRLIIKSKMYGQNV